MRKLWIAVIAVTLLYPIALRPTPAVAEHDHLAVVSRICETGPTAVVIAEHQVYLAAFHREGVVTDTYAVGWPIPAVSLRKQHVHTANAPSIYFADETAWVGTRNSVEKTANFWAPEPLMVAYGKCVQAR
jgi:hypothetical protein